MSSEPAPRALRRDAVRNRERIIEAARDLIATRGMGVGLNEIARHAGVGVGTVYRRFPERDALLDAALAEPIEQMHRVVGEAEVAERGWDGLESFLTSAAELLAANLALREIALSPGHDTAIDLVRSDFAEVAERLRSRAASEGDLRPDVSSGDLLLVLWMVTELAVHAHGTQPDLYRRYLRVLLDGMRNGPDRAPLEPALVEEEAARIALAWASHG